MKLLFRLNLEQFLIDKNINLHLILWGLFDKRTLKVKYSQNEEIQQFQEEIQYISERNPKIPGRNPKISGRKPKLSEKIQNISKKTKFSGENTNRLVKKKFLKNVEDGKIFAIFPQFYSRN